jgi:protoheme IX farnesyltransferase
VLLAKPGIILGNMVSFAGGFVRASMGRIDSALFAATGCGGALVIASGCVLNNYIDRDIELVVAVVLAGFLNYVVAYSLYRKRNSVHGTLVGSLSGATSPVAGYCAETFLGPRCIRVLPARSHRAERHDGGGFSVTGGAP